jgi:hypothetical protein
MPTQFVGRDAWLGANGGWLLLVALATSVNPSAEHASTMAASKRAKRAPIVASSRPVSRASAGLGISNRAGYG